MRTVKSLFIGATEQSGFNEKELKCNKLCQIFSTNPRFWSFVGILFYCQASAESLVYESRPGERSPVKQAWYTVPDERSPVKQDRFWCPNGISRFLESAALAWTRTWDNF